MSETTLCVTLQVGKKMKPGSVGVLQPGTLAKVLDLDTDRSLGPLATGELCFKGSQIMKGYIGNDQETKNTIDYEGWLHTGDVGYYDKDGEFFVVDRIKELIKYKGYQVPPAELEALLLANPKIKDAAVIGIPDEEAGELPMAFVVKQPNADLSEGQVAEYINGLTSPAKRLHGGVRFVTEIAKNPSGKILRRVLKEQVKRVK